MAHAKAAGGMRGGIEVDQSLRQIERTHARGQFVLRDQILRRRRAWAYVPASQTHGSACQARQNRKETIGAQAMLLMLVSHGEAMVETLLAVGLGLASFLRWARFHAQDDVDWHRQPCSTRVRPERQL